MKVRIPAIVSSDGRWCAYGYPDAERDPDWSMMKEVADRGDDTSCIYMHVWITVDLPTPKTAEAYGEVER